jgi:aspartate/methionine/tyrosine aminotransferase
MPSLSNSVRAIRAGVFAELQRRIDARGGDLIPLQIGDTIIEPPQPARQAADAHAGKDLHRYGATAGLPELRAAIGRAAARDRRIEADPDREILLGCGATHALFCVCRAILDPGDEVLLAAPYWPLAHGLLAACGARIVEVPLTTRLDAGERATSILAGAITEKTRAIYLITPNNPDGHVLSEAALSEIAELARAHDLWVVADEVYADHVFDRRHLSIATLGGMSTRTITAGSLSKSHALAGARVGWAIAPAEVVAAARRVSTHTVFNVPVVAQRAARAAIDDGQAVVAEARDHHRAARDAAVAALVGSGIRFTVPAGGTYLFLDLRPILGARPARLLLEAAIDRGVLLAPGEAFGEAYEGWARLCYSAVSLDRLALGIERLRAAASAFAGG